MKLIDYVLRALRRSRSRNDAPGTPADNSTGGLSSIEINARTEVPIASNILSLADMEAIQPPFVRLRVDLSGEEAGATACLAELEGGRYAVLVRQGGSDTDLFREVLKIARDVGDGQEPLVYSVRATLLVTMIRDGEQGIDLAARVFSSGGKSATRKGFRELVAWAVEHGASDLHLHIDHEAIQSRVSVSIDGHYLTPESLAMPTERMTEMVNVAWHDVRGGNGIMFDPTREQQAKLLETVNGKEFLLRWGSFVSDRGPSITLRILDNSNELTMRDLDGLGYLPSQIAQIERALISLGGAVIMGGVPGAGKSVLLFQIVGRVPGTRKVMTIEDPVELRLPHALQASVSRSIDGSDHDQIHAKLMAIKRAAASDVLFGEIRDRLSGAALQDILQSGSNAYTTVHATSGIAIPKRLASVQIGIPTDVLAAPRMLKLLGYQALIPVLCDCKLPATSLLSGGLDAGGIRREGEWWQRYLDRIERLYKFGSERLKIRNPEGCPHCRKRGLPGLYGYNGRTAAAEFFEPGLDSDALAAIAQGNELRLSQIYRSYRTAGYDDPNMDGKLAMECAVYRMSLGEIDPRDIEPKFQSFAAVEAERDAKRGTT